MKITIGVEFHRPHSLVSKGFYYYFSGRDRLFTLRIFWVFGISFYWGR